MRSWNSWKFYVGLICLGIAVWVVSDLNIVLTKKALIVNKSLGAPAVIESKHYSQMVFEWAKVIGQILAGAGSVAGAIRALIALFKRKN
jgi:hypothetical protein